MYVHVWQYLARLFSEWVIFQIKVLANLKTLEFYDISYFPKTVSFMKYVEQYDTARGATDDNIWVTQRMLFASWTNKAKHALQVCDTFHCKNGYANAPQNYVTPTHSLLFLCSYVLIHDVLTAVTTEMAALWRVMLPGLLQFQRISRRSYCLSTHL